MFSEKDILKVFVRLGLASEKERQRILSQGVVLHKDKHERSFWVETDNVTTLEKVGKSDAGLE